MVNVSKAWKRKFSLLEKMGADKHFIFNAMASTEFKALGLWERNKITFNFWAFLFSSVYYFSKSMWAKGSFILGLTWGLATLLTLVEVITGVEIPLILYWFPPAIMSAQLANYDYYRKVIHGEKMWSGLPSIFAKPSWVIGFPLVSSVLLFGVSMMLPTPVPTCNEKFTTDAVKQLVKREMVAQLGHDAESLFSYVLDDIRTTFTDSETGANECEAQLSISASHAGYTETIAITYAIESTDAGDQFYVSVLGL